MKVLSKFFGVALIAMTLAACGTSTTTPVATNYGQLGYNGTGQTGFTGQAGCVPIQSGSFSFTGQGASMNSAVLLAGNFPMNSPHPGQQFGQVTMGGSSFNTGGGMIQYQPKQGQSGTLQLTSSSTMGQGTVSGQIQLSPAVIQQIMAMSGYMNGGYTNTYPGNYQQTNLCVNSIALDVVQTVISNNYNTQYGQPAYNQGGMGQINQALVYLYLNNGQPVGPIVF